MSDATSLLPPNSSPLERAVEQTTERLGRVPVPLRPLWNPQTCPESLLPWLAWAFSLDSWEPSWPVAVKRARIRSAIEIQRRKGTSKSVRDVVASFGGALAIREWWQLDPPGEPHTFEVVLTLGGSQPASAEYQNDIVTEIERTKPVRSHFTFTLGHSAEARFGLLGAARSVIYRRIDGVEAP